jgi:hypothetical protein
MLPVLSCPQNLDSHLGVHPQPREAKTSWDAREKEIVFGRWQISEWVGSAPSHTIYPNSAITSFHVPQVLHIQTSRRDYNLQPVIAIMAILLKKDPEIHQDEILCDEKSVAPANDADITGFETDEADLPKGYFRSRFFLGSYVAIGFGLWGGTAAL